MFNRTVLITGGAGFIGSNLVKHFVKKYPCYRIINLDKLTYAANLNYLKEVEQCPNYLFIKGDICNFNLVESIFKRYNVTGVINLAAESHVDRSISNPLIFAKTNVLGTLTLLECAKRYWSSLSDKFSNKLFYHISTDEVYGALEMDNTLFTEETKYDPHSPYSASKASSDHFVRAFYDTYKMPTIISNCSNNYGPCQYTEKLIPLFIKNIYLKKPLPVYGTGENIRDWLYVEDHVEAIDLIFHNAKPNSNYNIGGMNEWKNIDLIKLLIKECDIYLGNKSGASLNLIKYVEDRKGHDLRYAIDPTKLNRELGWFPKHTFEEGIKETVKWYIDYFIYLHIQ